MSDREAFLRAVAADPADDTVRLAFADWLDENGDPARAEFIRLQIQRERSGIELSLDDRREQVLLAAKQSEWFGPLAQLAKKDGFEYTVRRGFVESAVIYGRLLCGYAAALREHCPALTELDVLGVRGHGQSIAANIPGEVRTLRLEDWPFPDDARALAESSRSRHLESLSFWIGSENDEKVCRAIAASRAFPALQRVELIQMAGGLDAGADVPRLDAEADRLAALINTKRKTDLATVFRPCSELLPLADYVGWNLHGGLLPNGRQALLHTCIDNNAGDCVVFYFDATGQLLSGERITLTGSLHQEPDWRGYNEKELFALMAVRIGFRPAMIRVREFDAEQVLPGCWTRIYKYDGDVEYFVSSPDSTHQDYSGPREEQLESARTWLRRGWFCITHGGDAAWAGPDGTIHST